MQKIKDWVAEAKAWYLRRKVLRDLKRTNAYSVEVEKVMENFATHQILNAASPDSANQSRGVLLKHQQVIRVKSDFQDFLDTL